MKAFDSLRPLFKKLDQLLEDLVIVSDQYCHGKPVLVNILFKVRKLARYVTDLAMTRSPTRGRNNAIFFNFHLITIAAPAIAFLKDSLPKISSLQWQPLYRVLLILHRKGDVSHSLSMRQHTFYSCTAASCQVTKLHESKHWLFCELWHTSYTAAIDILALIFIFFIWPLTKRVNLIVYISPDTENRSYSASTWLQVVLHGDKCLVIVHIALGVPWRIVC